MRLYVIQNKLTSEPASCRRPVDWGMPGCFGAPRLSSARAARPHLGMRLIAIFKFLKAAVLVAAGLAALGLLSPARATLTEAWLGRLALSQGHHLIAAWAERAATLLSAAGSRQLLNLAIGAFLYASLFLVEGVGLIRARRWAEYLTVVATSSYLPLEAWALWHHPAPAPAGTMILNVAVVTYLVLQIRADRRRSGLSRPGGADTQPAT